MATDTDIFYTGLVDEDYSLSQLHKLSMKQASHLIQLHPVNFKTTIPANYQIKAYKRRINELDLGINLPITALTRSLEVPALVVIVISRLAACGVEDLVIDRILCKTFRVCIR